MRPVRRFVSFVVRRRGWVLLACGLITVLAGLSLSRVVVATSFARMFLGEDPAYDEYVALSQRFGSDEVLLIGVDDPDFLTPAGQERLRRATVALDDVPGVVSAASGASSTRSSSSPGPSACRGPSRTPRRPPPTRRGSRPSGSASWPTPSPAGCSSGATGARRRS